MCACMNADCYFSLNILFTHDSCYTAARAYAQSYINLNDLNDSCIAVLLTLIISS